MTQQAGRIDRRAFIEGAAAAAATGAIGAGVAFPVHAQRTFTEERAADPVEWKNWSGSVSWKPAAFERPKTESEIQDLVRKAEREGLAIRVVGSGHSFTPLCATDGMLISLSDMTGVISTDAEKLEATVWGGHGSGRVGSHVQPSGFVIATSWS